MSVYNSVSILLCSLSLCSALFAGPQSRMVKDINGTPADTSYYFLTDMNGVLYFRANGKIWKSDGTSEGTVMVNPSGGSAPWYLTPANGLLFFTDKKQGDNAGEEMWVTDGTSAGTRIVKDVNPGPTDSKIAGVTELGGKVYFGADDGVHGAELWVSDGTSDGTYMVKDISPGIDSGIYLFNWEMVRVGGFLFFGAGNSTEGYGLWMSNGTEQGTTMVHDLLPGPESLDPIALTPVSNRLFFLGDDGVHGVEPWVSDGTSNGTFMIEDIYPGPFDSCPYFECLWETGGVGDTFLFAAEEQSGTIRFWVSDGSPGGAFPINAYGPGYFSRVGSAAYFSAWASSEYGEELWRSDGTISGTTMVKDINPDRNGNGPGFVSDIYGMGYFRASDGVNGFELWKTNGTEQGTLMVADIFPGTLDSSPAWITASNGRMFFVANDGAHGRELWVLDPDNIPASSSISLVLLVGFMICTGSILIVRRRGTAV